MKQAFWFGLYNLLFVPLGYLGIRVSGLFSHKVRAGIAGRKNLFSAIQAFNRTREQSRPLFVVHCASLGEYEMAQPVIARLKEAHPEIYIALTFFSPSGYERVGEEPPADLVTYLPFDSALQVDRFYRLLRPDKLVLTSYEVWPNLIWLAARHGVQIHLTSARLQNGNAKTYPLIRSLYSTVYGNIDHIYPITEEDRTNLQRYYHLPESVQVTVAGNTRYDRVLQRAAGRQEQHLLPPAFRHAPTVIAGSIWPADNRHLLPALAVAVRDYPELRVVLAPHEPSQAHLSELTDWCEGHDISYLYFSTLGKEGGHGPAARVLLVDTVGVLAELYHDGDMAFVGGGFSGSVHNVMEPAVARCVPLFGPAFHNSNEAEQLLAAGGGFAVSDAASCTEILRRHLGNQDQLTAAQQEAYQVIKRNAGAVEQTVRHLLTGRAGTA